MKRFIWCGSCLAIAVCALGGRAEAGGLRVSVAVGFGGPVAVAAPCRPVMAPVVAPCAVPVIVRSAPVVMYAAPVMVQPAPVAVWPAAPAIMCPPPVFVAPPFWNAGCGAGLHRGPMTVAWPHRGHPCRR